MRKGVLGIICISLIGLLLMGVFFMNKNIDDAFKKVENSLKRSKENIDTLNRQLHDSLNIKLKQ